MMPMEKKALFELTASELEEELSRMFQPLGPNHPIRCSVAAALVVAEAATQRISLKSFDRVDDSGKCNWPEFLALEEEFKVVEALNRYLILEGRLDTVLWDAAGYIHGWFLDTGDHLDVQYGSCPEVVAKLTSALQALAQCENEWRPLLEQYAANLASLVRLAREKAELQARAGVESQSWWRKLLFPTSLERELLSLGFR